MIKLFAGSNSSHLASEAAKLLNVPLAKAEVVTFDNTEVRVRVAESVKDDIAVVVQSTSNPTNSSLMELAFFADALRRGEAKKIAAVIPYFGYARQNIQHREGEAVSAHVVVRLLESVGFDEVYAFDIHDEGTAGIFSIPFIHLSALPQLALKIKEYLQSDDVVIVSPDQGGVERARNFGISYFGKEEFPLTIIEKKRDLDKIHKSKAVGFYGEVKDKTVIIIDDIVTSGGTLLNAVEECKKHQAKKIITTVVHSDFSSKAPTRLQNSPIEAYFTTNTIQLKEDQRFPKLKEVSIAPIIAQALQKS